MLVIKFMFEDNDEMPSNILLKSSYNGSNIYFTGGGNASNVFREVEKCKQSYQNCPIIIFFDLPSNNEKSMRNKFYV